MLHYQYRFGWTSFLSYPAVNIIQRARLSLITMPLTYEYSWIEECTIRWVIREYLPVYTIKCLWKGFTNCLKLCTLYFLIFCLPNSAARISCVYTVTPTGLQKRYRKTLVFFLNIRFWCVKLCKIWTCTPLNTCRKIIAWYMLISK